MFKRFHFIELEGGTLGGLGINLIQLPSGLLAEKAKLSGYRDAMDSKDDGDPAHGDSGGQKNPNGLIDSSFVLAKARGARR